MYRTTLGNKKTTENCQEKKNAERRCNFCSSSFLTLIASAKHQIDLIRCLRPWVRNVWLFSAFLRICWKIPNYDFEEADCSNCFFANQLLDSENQGVQNRKDTGTGPGPPKVGCFGVFPGICRLPSKWSDPIEQVERAWSRASKVEQSWTLKPAIKGVWKR